ncbi:MAG: hypothetical protein RIR18_1817 [Pseudomonadota bacterium]|jgi:hypothetical protein
MKSLSNQHRLNLVNTEQLFENFQAAQEHTIAHAYGMRWKTIRGTEYLFRDRDCRGYGRTLGKRSPETEAVLTAFKQGKIAADERFLAIKTQLDEQSRMNKALR